MAELLWRDIWPEDELKKLENSFIDRFIKCDTPQAVEVAINFCKFLNYKGLDGDNYPLFLEMLKNENHYVIDALIGDKDPFTFFSEAQIQPNRYSLEFCFNMLNKYNPGTLYNKTLMIIVGIISNTYKLFSEGYKIYPMNISDVNNIGKNLDEKQDQNYELNKIILDILYEISESENLTGDDKNWEEISLQATNIRNCFLDANKSLKEAIPEKLLESINYKKPEVATRKKIPINQIENESNRQPSEE